MALTSCITRSPAGCPLASCFFLVALDMCIPRTLLGCPAPSPVQGGLGQVHARDPASFLRVTLPRLVSPDLLSQDRTSHLPGIPCFIPSFEAHSWKGSSLGTCNLPWPFQAKRGACSCPSRWKPGWVLEEVVWCKLLYHCGEGGGVTSGSARVCQGDGVGGKRCYSSF